MRDAHAPVWNSARAYASAHLCMTEFVISVETYGYVQAASELMQQIQQRASVHAVVKTIVI